MNGLKSQSELLDGKLPGVSGEIEIKKTICDICNPATHCGIDAYVKDGVVIKVAGSKENPRSGGKLCVKGAASRQYIYSNDRILKPLKRVGERGSDHFVPISWEDALCIIAERLTDIKDTTGPEGVVFYAGYPKWMRPYLQRLALNFGTPNYCTENSVCWMATTVAAKLNYGAWGFPEIGKTDCLLNWGRNPVWSNAPLSRKIIAAKKRGIKIIDVGPLISPSAQFADIHLRIRPGTSGALALGLAHIIIEEELYDRKFVSTYTQGFDEYQDYVMEFPPQRVQEITGVPVRSMRDAARLYATSKTAAMLCSPNTSVHHTNGVNNHRLITALAGLTGNFDREGGNYVVPESYIEVENGLITRQHEFALSRSWAELAQRVGQEEFPVWAHLVDEGQAMQLPYQIRSKQPYPIRAMVAFGLNYHLWPGSDFMRDSLKELDFLAVADLFLTQSAKLADIILPACSSFERSELKLYPEQYAIWTKPTIEPRGESRPDNDIIVELAKQLTPGDLLLTSGHEACVNWILEPSGLTTAELKKHPGGMPLKNVSMPPYEKYKLHGFNTPSRKMEFTSTTMKNLGLDPLPRYIEPQMSPISTPEIFKEYPLILTTGARLPMFIHSRTFRMSSTRSLRPDPMVDINPHDAAERGLGPDDWIELKTPRNSLRLKANLTEMVPPGVVSVYHNYPGADVNELIEPNYQDPISGYPGFKALLCQVTKEQD